MIRTVLVDDEVLARIGIQSLIDGKEDIAVSGVFASAEEALACLRETPADIVITDIEMSSMTGLEFIKIIRQERLADGIIILSCHDDFRYAQEAISHGVDSYLLKFGISENSLIAEVKKVYQKTHRERDSALSGGEHHYSPHKSLRKGCVYMVGAFQAAETESGSKESFDRVMLAHLMEDIISRYQMGNFYAPFGKDNFIVFQFEQSVSARERDRLLYENCEILRKSIQQYTTARLIFGISTPFYKEIDIAERYDEAVSALTMRFYHSEQTIFLYEPPRETQLSFAFSARHFLEREGAEEFQDELRMLLRSAQLNRVPVDRLKERLIQAVSAMTFRVMEDYGFSEKQRQKWNAGSRLISTITLAKRVETLESALIREVAAFRQTMIDALEADELLKAFHYINSHLSEKITLNDLTELCCMSVPSFSKKFKDRTGLTLVQYLNKTRVEKAKTLLRQREYSLQQVAEETGFSSANYLVRVFKKVEGQTVGDYRRQFGITGGE